MPSFTQPMLATLTKQVFSDPDWVYEPKLDGQRSLLWRRGDTVRLLTRNEKDRTAHYPDLSAAILRDETPPLIADGEIVAFDGDVTSFSRLQGRMQNARPNAANVAAVPVYFYLFDLIWFDGYDLSALPLVARKSVLREALTFDDPIRFSEHLDEDGEAAFEGRVREGLGGARRQASRVALHPRAVQGLAQVQVQQRAGVHRDRVDRAARVTLGLGGAARRVPRRRRRCGSAGRSAPASTSRS